MAGSDFVDFENVKLDFRFFELSKIYFDYLEGKKEDVTESLKNAFADYIISEKDNWPLKRNGILFGKKYPVVEFSVLNDLFDGLKKNSEDIKSSCMPEGYNGILAYMYAMNTSLKHISEDIKEFEKRLDSFDVTNDYIIGKLNIIGHEITKMNKELESFNDEIESKNIDFVNDAVSLDYSSKENLRLNINEFNKIYMELVKKIHDDRTSYSNRVKYFSNLAEKILEPFNSWHGKKARYINEGTFESAILWYETTGLDGAYGVRSLLPMTKKALKDKGISVVNYLPCRGSDILMPERDRTDSGLNFI